MNQTFFQKKRNASPPLLIEKEIKKEIPKRSLSPYLTRKIHDSSFKISRESSPKTSRQEKTILNQNPLYFCLPALLNKEKISIKNQYEKEMNFLKESSQKDPIQKNAVKIIFTKEKISRIISKNQRIIEKNKNFDTNFKEIATNKYRQNLGKFSCKEYEILELEKTFKNLSKKIAAKPNLSERKMSKP